MCLCFTDLITEQLEGFGIPSKAIQKAISSKMLLTENDIRLDNDHPPAEALGYALTHIKQYMDENGWEKVTTAGMFGTNIKRIKALSNLLQSGTY